MSLLFNSPSKDSPSSQKKVTFSPNVSMRLIKETAQSSGDTTWYQQRHYNAFLVDCQKTAATVARDLKGLGNLIYARKYFFSTRGLEHYVDQERGALRRDRRLAAWDLVLDEQMYQYESGYYQPQHIAEAYQEVSVRSLCKAQKSYEHCHTNFRSMLTRRLGKKNVYECNTNLRSMTTRRQGMKNVYECNTNLRPMLTRRQGMKNIYECNTNLRPMLTRRQGMKNVYYECNANLRSKLRR
jgi:hypothetical protein